MILTRADIRRYAVPAALASFLAALLAGSGKPQALACAAVLFLCALPDFGLLRRSARLRWWTAPLLFALLTPFFVGAQDLRILARPYSSPQLRLGLGFLLQAYAFTVLAAALSETYCAQEAVSFFERLGLRGAGLRLALAAAAARRLGLLLRETWESYRLDRPGTLQTLRDVPLLASALARGADRTAEELSRLLYLRNIRP
ncbi:MAG: hypothetical protein WCU88_03525 [Elusimicrobiota bacterium]